MGRDLKWDPEMSDMHIESAPTPLPSPTAAGRRTRAWRTPDQHATTQRSEFIVIREAIARLHAMTSPTHLNEEGELLQEQYNLSATNIRDGELLKKEPIYPATETLLREHCDIKPTAVRDDEPLKKKPIYSANDCGLQIPCNLHTRRCPVSSWKTLLL